MDELKAGDTVLDLQACTRSSGMFAGLIAGPVLANFNGWGWWSVLASILAGLAGVAIGVVVSRIVFPAPPGHTVIVRPGMHALGIALWASLASGVIVTGLLATTALVTVGGFAALVTLLVGLATSVVKGCGSALM